MHPIAPLVDQNRHRRIRASIGHPLYHLFHDHRIAQDESHTLRRRRAAFLAHNCSQVVGTQIPSDQTVRLRAQQFPQAPRTFVLPSSLSENGSSGDAPRRSNASKHFIEGRGGNDANSFDRNVLDFMVTSIGTEYESFPSQFPAVRFRLNAPVLREAKR
jgi:hypothetical protein